MGTSFAIQAHILCVLESCIAAIYHAADSILEPLDKVLTNFLRELGLTSEQGFLNFNLASLNFRRDVAMLGLLHKCALGEAHPWLLEHFPTTARGTTAHNTRHSRRRHSRQLHERCTGNFLEVTRRSLFGLVRVYNFLPEAAVSAKTVKEFQSKFALIKNPDATTCAQKKIQLICDFLC